MKSLHSHTTTQSRDCDGEYRSGRVDMMTSEEERSDFGDILFKERIISSVISVYAEHGTLEITSDRVDYHEQTEEGYRSSVTEWCEDTCSDLPWQRDMSAEAAGY